MTMKCHDMYASIQFFQIAFEQKSSKQSLIQVQTA